MNEMIQNPTLYIKLLFVRHAHIKRRRAREYGIEYARKIRKLTGSVKASEGY